MTNVRFAGAWVLDRFETEQADGAVSRPWGDNPLGIIVWDATGYFSAQLGPREPRADAPWVAYYGTLDAPDGDSGTLTHSVLGSSNPARLAPPQVREFRFLDADTLVLRPPAAANGSRSSLTWKRKHSSAS